MCHTYSYDLNYYKNEISNDSRQYSYEIHICRNISSKVQNRAAVEWYILHKDIADYLC